MNKKTKYITDFVIGLALNLLVILGTYKVLTSFFRFEVFTNNLIILLVCSAFWLVLLLKKSVRKNKILFRAYRDNFIIAFILLSFFAITKYEFTQI